MNTEIRTAVRLKHPRSTHEENIVQDLSHQDTPQHSRQYVLITGGTGFIGEALVKQLLNAGHTVTVITRHPSRATCQFQGKVRCIQALSELHHNEHFDVIINLAGTSVVGPRWSTARKATLLQSRVGITQALVDWVATTKIKPSVWVQASAIGYYGTQPSHVLLTEDSPAGHGFMSTLCSEWEVAAQSIQKYGVRLVTLRLGLVFGPGSSLPALVLPYRFGFGGKLGNGEQTISWIHREDVLRLIAKAITVKHMHGVYNATAPESVTQAQFAATVGQVLHRPVWFHIPATPIRWLAGEMAQLFVDGQRVIPARLIGEGFHFRYPTLKNALDNLL